MLSSIDIALVRRDSALPGLATLLDPSAFLTALRSAFPKVQMQSAKLSYLRYKFQTSCLAQYEIQTSDSTIGLHAVAHRADAEGKLRKFEQKTPAASGAIFTRVLLRETFIALYPFPEDDGLKVLPYLFDDKTRRQLLFEMLPEATQLWDSALETLAYKPKRRYVASLRSEAARTVLRHYTPSGYRCAEGNTESFCSQSLLRVPRFLGRSSQNHLIALEWLPGTLLSELLPDSKFQPERLSLVGSALAELHAQDADNLTVLNREDESARLMSLADDLSLLCPELSLLSQTIAQRLASKVRALPKAYQPIHGDFYAKQVLLGKGNVGLLDFDEAVQSDGAADLGNFIAHLERDALQGNLGQSHLEEFQVALLTGYGDTAGESSLSRVRLYSAVGLFRLAMEPFRRHELDWLERIEALLLRVQSILNGSTPASYNLYSHKINELDSFSISDDAKMPFLAQAINPASIQSALEFDLAGQQNRFKMCRLKAIRVKRYKPARRCLIEYDLELSRSSKSCFITLLGKARAKGLHQESYRVQRELWNTGFDGNSADGVSVPRPVGKITQFEMWLQEKVAGQNATTLLAESPDTFPASRIAEGIYRLHNSGLVPRHRHTMSDELRILHDRLQGVVEKNPSWQRRLERVVAACDRIGASVDGTMTCGIHRDFYADQVLTSGARVYLLDFDLFCEGNPALDIGNFVAHMSEQSLRSHGDTSANAEREEELIERYLSLCKKNMSAAIRAYTTLSLVRHISLSTQFEERKPFTQAILELCEQRLEIKTM